MNSSNPWWWFSEFSFPVLLTNYTISAVYDGKVGLNTDEYTQRLSCVLIGALNCKRQQGTHGGLDIYHSPHAINDRNDLSDAISGLEKISMLLLFLCASCRLVFLNWFLYVNCNTCKVKQKAIPWDLTRAATWPIHSWPTGQRCWVKLVLLKPPSDGSMQLSFQTYFLT